MKKIKKGDEIIVIAGKDKGKQGQVLEISDGKIRVQGINIAKKMVKPNPQTGEKGGIQDKEMFFDASNANLYDPNTKTGSRVQIRVLEDGTRARYFKASGQPVDVKS